VAYKYVLRTNTFFNISQTTLYTFSQNKGVHDNGGGSGWSLEGKRSMTNYTKKSRPIESNLLQHSTRSFLKFIS
jgi:hypothetical protein